MTDIIDTAEKGRLRVRLVPDENARNPREDDDNLAHVITIDTHLGCYKAVDQNGGPLANAWKRVSWNRWKGVDIFTRYARIFHDAIVIESRPERGPVSLWYLMGEDAQDLGILPEGYLDAERVEYEAWVQGEVYGWIIEEAVERQRTDDEHDIRTAWEEVDSCYGHYGYAWAAAQAREALAFYTSKMKAPAA